MKILTPYCQTCKKEDLLWETLTIHSQLPYSKIQPRYSSKKCQKSNRCRCQQRAVCPQHLGVGALAGRAPSVRFSVSLKFPRAIASCSFKLAYYVNLYSQCVHLNVFSLMWMLSCCLKLADIEDFYSHIVCN